MGQRIATTLHKAAEFAPDEPLVSDAARLPHYVIDWSLIQLFSRSDVSTSIRALIEANIARLPFPELLVELQAPDEHLRRFVVLRETVGNASTIEAEIFSYGFPVGQPESGVLFANTRPSLVRFTDSGLSVEQAPTTGEGLAIGLAAAVALLMLNTRGIDKERIVAPALNRQRAAKGLPGVPTHTLVRIGTIYDREGQAVAHGSGRHTKVYLRAGHARRTYYGKGKSQVKIDYIAPVLVNYAPGADVPTPRKVIAR